MESTASSISEELPFEDENDTPPAQQRDASETADVDSGEHSDGGLSPAGEKKRERFDVSPKDSLSAVSGPSKSPSSSEESDVETPEGVPETSSDALERAADGGETVPERLEKDSVGDKKEGSSSVRKSSESDVASARLKKDTDEDGMPR